MHDDRPPKVPAGWVKRLNAAAARIIDNFPDPPAAPFTAMGGR